jgi:hypothetical protein
METSLDTKRIKGKLERVVQEYIHRRSMQDVWMMKVAEARMNMQLTTMYG